MAILAAILAVAALIGWAEVLMIRKERDLKVESAKNRMNDMRGQFSTTIDKQQEVIASLRTQLAKCRKARNDEAAQYMERASIYEDRISELIRQSQNMAERVASLRKEGLPEGGEDFHVDAPEPREPWSTDLREFYEGIVSREAQQYAEDFITRRREAGVADEQILNELEEEWSA